MLAASVPWPLPQLVAEVRVGDADQQLGPLAQALAGEVGRALLGDQVEHVGASGDYASAGLLLGLAHQTI